MNWSKIPSDLLIEILSKCDMQTVMFSSGVCRSWKNATRQNEHKLWGRFISDKVIGNHPLISHKYYALKSEGFTRQYTRNNNKFTTKLWTLAPFFLVILNLLALLSIQSLSLPVSPFFSSMCLTFVFFIIIHLYLYNKYTWYHERKWKFFFRIKRFYLKTVTKGWSHSVANPITVLWQQLLFTLLLYYFFNYTLFLLFWWMFYTTVIHHRFRLASAAVVLSISWLIYDAILVRFDIWTDLSMWMRCGPLMIYSCVVLPRYFMDAVIGNTLVGSVVDRSRRAFSGYIEYVFFLYLYSPIMLSVFLFIIFHADHTFNPIQRSIREACFLFGAGLGTFLGLLAWYFGITVTMKQMSVMLVGMSLGQYISWWLVFARDFMYEKWLQSDYVTNKKN